MARRFPWVDMTDRAASATHLRNAAITAGGPIAPAPDLRPLSPAAYLTAFHRLQGRYTAAFRRLAALDRAPRSDDDRWREAYRRTLGEILLLDAAATGSSPPACLEEVHDTYLQAVRSFTATAALVLHQLARTNCVESEEAADSMRAGICSMDRANELLSRASCL